MKRRLVFGFGIFVIVGGLSVAFMSAALKQNLITDEVAPVGSMSTSSFPDIKSDSAHETNEGLLPSSHISASETVGADCIQNDKYIAVSVRADIQQLPVAYVYRKTANTTCKQPGTVPVFTLELEVTYLSYIIGDFLVTDTGTAPSGRVLSAYNLLTQTEVFSEEYGGDVVPRVANTIEYWRPSGAAVSVDNCPNKIEIEKEYLIPQVQELVSRNLSSGQVVVQEMRCVGVL